MVFLFLQITIAYTAHTMAKEVYQKIVSNKKNGKKSIAVLIDPDKVTEESCKKVVNLANDHAIDFIIVGGSLMTSANLHNTVACVKENTNLPLILFPGNNLYLDHNADALLLLSLISGRNPDLLIGQHIAIAPILKNSALECMPTGYILVDGGKPTTVSYISNTTPIPAEKEDIAACTAIAGELLGMKLIFMDAGSGALTEISPKMIHLVSKSIDIPLIIGGGINTIDKVNKAFDAGADVVVIGTQIEKDHDFVQELSKIKRE